MPLKVTNTASKLALRINPKNAHDLYTKALMSQNPTEKERAREEIRRLLKIANIEGLTELDIRLLRFPAQFAFYKHFVGLK